MSVRTLERVAERQIDVRKKWLRRRAAGDVEVFLRWHVLAIRDVNPVV